MEMGMKSVVLKVTLRVLVRTQNAFGRRRTRTSCGCGAGCGDLFYEALHSAAGTRTD